MTTVDIKTSTDRDTFLRLIALYKEAYPGVDIDWIVEFPGDLKKYQDGECNFAELNDFYVIGLPDGVVEDFYSALGDWVRS
jgi:GH18 family chitinase